MVWDQVQQKLTEGAQKTRGTKRKVARSLLAGKIFDETGDRLTPSQSRKHQDAWRLPAGQMKGLIADLVRKLLQRSDNVSRFIQDLAATEVVAKSARLRAVQQTTKCLHLVERAELSQGAVVVYLNHGVLARKLEIGVDRINADELILTSPFRMRRRGVELKLHLGEAPPEIDQTLVQDIVKAQRCMGMILEGKTNSEIAEADGTSKRRVQDVVDLATLAPDILDAIAKGGQPDGLTSDTVIKSGVPASWSEQRKQFAKL